MTSIAIFGDIHGNLPALEAVLADMATRAFTARYCLGDLVGYGTFPNEVIDIIRQQQIPTLMGNYDQGVGHSSADCGCAYSTPAARALGERSIVWSNAHTHDDHKAFLRALPAHIPLAMDGFKILLVHGSPRKINEYLYEDRPDSTFTRLLDAAEVQMLVCGHTHLPYHKILPDGRHIINAGSVGKPKDNNPAAGYVALDVVHGTPTVTFIRVPYDVERAAQAIEATAMPAEFATMLRLGRG
ncbi:MAG: metallophosphatase family protein [Anaerolineae bacterium]|nr:metallophosphatase family protein [Anaerolineae bacterium]